MITSNARVVDGDIDDLAFDEAVNVGVIGCDIETTGLDWRSEKIGTVQVSVGDHVIIVRQGHLRPFRLIELLESANIAKIFHHASFDLRFLRSHWGVRSANVRCTKVAAKIAAPGMDSDSYSLKSLLSEKLGVEIDKSERMSDWTKNLTSRQVAYAANDVVHLAPLWKHLEAEVRAQSRSNLLEESLRYLQVRVELDLLGVGDPFTY
ncbi:ribonuclease H-like domain-containing protein [Pseudolysinimonas sp.]